MKTTHANLPQALPAATVILTRGHRSQLQVYLLKRHAASGFMAGHYVFPGGVLEPEDWRYAFWEKHVDLDVGGLSRRPGGDSLTAQEIMAYGVAAIRETVEEAGVFFAKRDNHSPSDTAQIGSRCNRAGLPRQWLMNLAASQGWTLTLSALSPWSHWITPERMQRRYDTRFWLAVMPADQKCRPDRLETTHGLWINPAKGLAANLSGQVPLSPPTLVTLQQLLVYRSLDDLKKEMHRRKWGAPILPRMIPLESGAVLIEPWDAAYHQPEIEIDAAGLKDRLLPAGQPFSRIWYHQGLYRPVKA